MVDTELRENTEAFIARSPVGITLSRRARVEDGVGGWKWGATSSVAEQTFRKTAMLRGSSKTERVTSNGVLIIPEFLLVCLVDADIKRYDTFSLNGQEHEVVFVSKMRWSTHAEVHELGS